MSKKLLMGLVVMLLSFGAMAGTLKKCEGVNTSSGYKYVGTYCVDFACQYVTTRMFDTYCPYSID